MRERGWLQHALALAPVLLCFVAAIAIVHPFADLTYGGDDWAYAWSVQRMVLDHKLVASSWVAATSVPQIFYGAAFCKVFGLTFRSMNVATMVFSLAGPVVFYFSALALGLRVKQSALLAFFATLSPHYLSYACSFMSDLYYAVLMLGTVLLYLHGLLQRKTLYLLAGSVLASLALMQRQIGVVIPAALVLSLLIGVLAGRRRLKSVVLDSLAAAVAPAVVTLAMRAFPNSFGGVTHTQEVKMDPAAMAARFKDVGQSLGNGYTTLVYIAVLSLPLCVAVAPALWRGLAGLSSRPLRALLIVLMAIALAGYAAAMSGHGELILEGEFLHPAALPLYGGALWKALALLGSLVFPLVLTLAAARLWSQLRSPSSVAFEGEPSDAPLAGVFLTLMLLLHVLLVAIWISFFNNYFLPLILLAALLLAYALAPQLNRLEGRLPLALAVSAAVLAIAGAIVPMDLLARYVEADDKLTAALAAEGTPDAHIYGYAGSYPRRHYDLADAEIQKNPWGIFSRLRQKATLVLAPAGLKVPALWSRKSSDTEYKTLIGRRTIDVWAKAPRKPRAPKHKPKKPEPKPESKSESEAAAGDAP